MARRKARGGREGRLALSISVYAGSLALVAALISAISRTRWWEEVRHPAAVVWATLGLAGFIAGVIVALLLLRLTRDDLVPGRGGLTWVMMGAGFAVMVPFGTGALLPLTTVVALLLLGRIDLATFAVGVADWPFRLPWTAITQGAVGVPSGLLAGGLFAAGGWGIERAGMSSNRTIATLVSPAVAVGLALVVLGVAVFTPATVLSQLGWGPSGQ